EPARRAVVLDQKRQAHHRHEQQRRDDQKQPEPKRGLPSQPGDGENSLHQFRFVGDDVRSLKLSGLLASAISSQKSEPPHVGSYKSCDYFLFPSSDDNFSSAFDKSAGFCSGAAAGFAGAGGAAFVSASSLLASVTGAATGGAGFGPAAGWAACGKARRSRIFSAGGLSSAPARR